MRILLFTALLAGFSLTLFAQETALADEVLPSTTDADGAIVSSSNNDELSESTTDEDAAIVSSSNNDDISASTTVAPIVSSNQKKTPFFSFSIKTHAGVLYGQSAEIVYWSNTRSDKLSLLLWDLKPLVYAGTELNLEPTDSFHRRGPFVRANVTAGIPGLTGVMED
jgi:hypothetical protein